MKTCYKAVRGPSTWQSPDAPRARPGPLQVRPGIAIGTRQREDGRGRFRPRARLTREQDGGGDAPLPAAVSRHGLRGDFFTPREAEADLGSKLTKVKQCSRMAKASAFSFDKSLSRPCRFHPACSSVGATPRACFAQMQ